MTLESYAHLAQIIGTVIVVVTLVYLSVQVRQGAHLMRSESRQAMMNNDRDVLLAYLENQDLFDKMSGPQQLSRSDQRRFSALWIINLRNREHEWFQYRDGILDERTWLSYRDILPVILSSKRQRDWWNHTKRGFDADYVELVDSLIAETPESDFWENYMGEWDRGI